MYALKTIISPNKEFEKFQFTPTSLNFETKNKKRPVANNAYKK